MAQAQQTDSLQTLKAALRAKLPERVYIFHGEEKFLLNYYLQQLRKLLVDSLTESFNFHKLTAEHFDVRSLADAVENLPMMAERTMVWVDEVDIFKLPEDERNKLEQVITDVPDYCTIVFTYETTPWKPDKRLKKYWEVIESNAQIVEFPKQDHKDLTSWVMRHFSANQKSISAQLCVYLIDITGGTMTALSGEIEKICAYSDAPVITKSDIDAVTEPVLDAVIFEMTNLLTDGMSGPAFQKLQTLLKMQNDPIAILGAVGSHFRRLSAARIVLDSGKGIDELCKIANIREYPAKKAMEAARKFSSAFLKKAAELVMQTDYRMKTSYDDPQRLLEILLLQISQEAKNV